jgi:hypothetical protein
MNNTKPNIYNHSKLYKLQCDDGYMYIGCTTQALSVRLGEHKKRSKIDINRNVYSHINIIGWDKVKIILISEHNLENREQLLREEDRLIKEYKDDEYCLNVRRSFTGLNKKEYAKEYAKENEDRIRELGYIYRENNKDKIKEYFKEYHLKNQEKKRNMAKEHYEKNKDKILEQQRKKIECTCGIIYNNSNKAKHEKSKKHIDFINSHVGSSDILEPNDTSSDIATSSSSLCVSLYNEECLQ